MKIKDLLLVLFSSVLLILIFPKFDLTPLSWIALVPFFYSLEGKKPGYSFFLGWSCGALFFLGIIYWIINTMVNYGHISIALSLIILIIFAVYLGLFFGLFSYIISYIELKLKILPWSFAPFIWVSMELLRTYILTGFPWALLGYSQYKNLELIQFSDITGVYGVSFLLVMVNSCIYLAISKLKIKKEKEKGISFLKRNKTVLTYFAVAIMFIIFSIGYGEKEINHFYSFKKAAQKSGNRKFLIALIQGNIEQDKKWDKRYQDETIRTYQRLTDESLKQGADLIVWPETATPFYLQSEGYYLNHIFNYLKEKDVYLLTGSPAYENKKNGTIENYNSAFLLSPDFRILNRYDKIHLVPFGEFVPLEGILKINLFRDIIGEIGSFRSGRNETVFTLLNGKFGTVICFEIIFPELVRKFIKKGGELIVTITNDAWFGRSSAPYQHFAMAVFRSVENKVYVARAANTGISGFISPIGEIISKTDIFVEGYLRGEVYLINKKTFYTSYGDIFAWLCFFITIGVCVYAWVKKKDCFS